MFEFISNAFEKSREKKIEKNKEKIFSATKDYLEKIGADYERNIVLEIKKKFFNLDIGDEKIEIIINRALMTVGTYINISKGDGTIKSVFQTNNEYDYGVCIVDGLFDYSYNRIVKYRNSTSGTNYHFKE